MLNKSRKSHLHLIGILLILSFMLAGYMAPVWAAGIPPGLGDDASPTDTVGHGPDEIGSGHDNHDGDPDEDELTVIIAVTLIRIVRVLGL
ncbi:MAG: hypothetical protein KJ970_13040 [Candidatus Eisenbacteria bacterium]|uniref:Uncharacterized protein n=1 Tax=Eiseniibacteriota bacterium TaxID=2212470 RepID=A0A948W749_UNCEI|nr:hypothetical protein [Candidatus Eisenbacteria bacterium]MBU1947301.1 hypothetical protein [Candidatus Eisenbacteria bacterium]MBU2691840.1 hypothetical protein [Candidatus Eisenbacteria bacterium]